MFKLFAETISPKLVLLLGVLFLFSCGGNDGNSTDRGKDTTPPTVTLNGANPLALNQGDTYVEPGATATDDVDGSVPVTLTGAVDTSTPGTYIVKYSAIDSANNIGTATRTVNVVALPTDTTSPVIVLNGANPLSLNQGDTYNEPGATATDDVDGNVSVTISGSVDSQTVGVYTITYSAIDNAGNPATTTRTVNVIAVQSDTTPPEITLIGDNPMTVVLGTTYVELGATAIDNIDGDISANIVISGIVDTSTLGTYTVTYSAADAANNPSSADRIVNVVSSIQRPFITKWKTDNPGLSADNQITITTDSPYSSYASNFTVDWGDSTTSNATGDITHTYATPGTYTVMISGNLSNFLFLTSTNGNDAKKLLSVEQWGTTQWKSMIYAFSGCENLVINASDVPDLSQVSNMSYMFKGAIAFDQDISAWDVSSVTKMTSMFEGASSFNQNLNNWNVSSVSGMTAMFKDASAFNGDISSWDVSSVTSMSNMFSNASVFNQDISTWNIVSLTGLGFWGMFSGASSFNQDIGGWDVSKITSFEGVFSRAAAFNQDISGWDVSAATKMPTMFYAATAFNQDISGWDVSSVTDMRRLFSNATAFNQDISGWDVSSVRYMYTMFEGATSFNQAIGIWNTSSVIDMSSMFKDAILFNQDINAWDVSLVQNMSLMFAGATAFNQDLSGWSTSSVKYMNSMFDGATAFNQDLSGWDVSSVIDMRSMFRNATAFNQDISGWDVSSVIYMYSVFQGATSFNQAIGGWNTSSVIITNSMFKDATAFNQDISAWNTSSVTSMDWMFMGATAFDQNLGAWNVNAVTSMTEMFAGIALSTANYDGLLTGWSAQNLQSGVNFHAGGSQYSSTSQAARDILTDAYGWIVSDGGVAP